jgi:hypothetical protein
MRQIFSFLFLFYKSSFASQALYHSQGAEMARGLQEHVTDSSRSTNPGNIPGFKTATPPEVGLNSSNMADSAMRQIEENEAALHIAQHARERKSFHIDPKTDPMVLNATVSISNPQLTIKEVMVQESSGATGDGHEKIFTCDEGGGEYAQSCSKKLEVELKVTEHDESHYRCVGRFGHSDDSPVCSARSYYTVKRKNVEVVREEWVTDCAHLESLADQGLCRYDRFEKGVEETRTISGEIVTRPCWQEKYHYVCSKVFLKGCADLKRRGCIQTKSECLERVGGVCVAWRQTYKCMHGKVGCKTYRSLSEKSLFCLTGNCVDASYEANTEMFQALTQLSVLKEAQNDIRANIGIFRGQKRECRKNCVGFRDCCTTGKGWGVSLHLAGCSGEETELADWRSKNRCILVGTYCAEKALGQCIRKKTSFCCFGTKLSKIIQEQGRFQLGRGWGDVKNPDCGGLSPEELGRIDLSRVDLSELYADIQANFKPQSQEQISKRIELERIQENMKILTRGSRS